MSFLPSDLSGVDRTPAWVGETRKNPPDPRRVRVLVVDDMSSMRSVMTGILRNLGFTQVFQADDGQRALERLQAGGIDLLITDWSMPGIDGVELIMRTRASVRFGRLPILMVSANAGREHIERAAERGVDGFIVKPFTPVVLGQKLAEILQRKRDVLELLWAGKPTGAAAPQSAPAGDAGKPAANPIAAANPATAVGPSIAANPPIATTAAARTHSAAPTAATPTPTPTPTAGDPAQPAPVKRFKLSAI